MTFIRWSQLNFHFVPLIAIGLLQQQVEPAGTGPTAFFILQDDIT